jgi:squid-like protein
MEGATIESRKLFVGGLSSDTNEKDLTDYFSKYGEVESVELKKDTVTQRSRGFAFLTFKDENTLNQAAAEQSHTIKGKKIGTRKAKVQTSKIFIGGIKEQLTDDEIKNHFRQFGKITDAEIPFDKKQNKRKGFCFLIFEGFETAKEIIKQTKGKQTISGVEVDVKKAIPPEQQGMARGFGFRGFASGDSYNGYGGGYDYGYYDYYGYPNGYDYGYDGYDYGYSNGYGSQAPSYMKNPRGRAPVRGQVY